MDSNELNRTQGEESRLNQNVVYKPVKKEGYLKQKWFAFGCLTSIILIVIFSVVLFSALAMLGRKKTVSVRPGTFLNLRLTGMIDEHKEMDQDIFSFTKTLTAREIIDRINVAANDDNIQGIILEPSFVAAGYSTLNEIISALQDFRQRGKPVYAYLELASNRDYYLSSAADMIYLNPAASSGIFLSGIGTSSLYMKDLLGKLGVEVLVLHSGDYKGAGESFDRMTMSRQFRESMNYLIDDLYTQMLHDIAEHRELDPELLRQVYEERADLFINQDYALEMEIVDQLASREMMLSSLGIDTNRLMRITRYDKRGEQKLRASDKVAVVYLQGTITPATPGFGQESISARKFKTIIDNIEKDRSIKGVVLRINSPGGSAFESDKIFHHIQKTNLTKPIVISMGAMATSGGYYISAPASYIYADPYTITGSIGGVSMIPNFYNMGRKIGVNVETVHRGKFTNFLNTFERPKPSEVAALQRFSDSVYEEFLQRVVEGRNMPLTQLEPIAQGKIWSSKRALENGLIDGIGSLEDAVNKAAELAGVTDYRTIYLPETKTLFDYILEKRFDISVITQLISSSIIQDERLEDAYLLLQLLKEEPVMLISPLLYVD